MAPAAHAHWWRDSVTVNGPFGDVRAAPGSTKTTEPRGKWLMTTFGDVGENPGPVVGVVPGSAVTFTAAPAPRRVELSLAGRTQPPPARAGAGRYTLPVPDTVFPVELRVTIAWERGRYERESRWSARLVPVPAVAVAVR